MPTKYTIEITARNNADARRMGNGQIKVPAAKATHLGGKKVRLVVSTDAAATLRWIADAVEVVDYHVV